MNKELESAYDNPLLTLCEDTVAKPRYSSEPTKIDAGGDSLEKCRQMCKAQSKPYAKLMVCFHILLEESFHKNFHFAILLIEKLS